MAQQLVAHVWLGGVEGATGVADVLRRVEHPERQTSQEVSRRQQTGYGAQSETGAIYTKNEAIFMLRLCCIILKKKYFVHIKIAWCPLIEKIIITFEEIGHVLELGDVVLTVVTVLHEQRENVVMFFAGMCWVKLCQLPEDYPPGIGLLFGVVDVGQYFSTVKYLILIFAQK